MILYFTGTGNSRFAASRIAENIGDDAFDLLQRLRAEDFSVITSDSPWVIVTPTYAWRIPRIVENLLRKTELKGSRDMYFVMTCGDDIGNAAKYLNEFCIEKGMNFMGVKAVVMPENYIAMFNAPEEPKAKEIVSRTLPVIDEISETIRNGGMLHEPLNIKGRIESSIVNPAFYKFCIKDGPFVVSDSCTSCGLCESLCPLNNIVMENDRPVWKGGCTHCMACICHCPEGAIEYGKASVGKPRYKCPDLKGE